MINTKAYRQQTIDTPHNNIAIINAMCDELDRLYHIEAKTNPSLEGLRIPIFAKRETLKPQILRDCGVAIGELFPIVSNWLSIAADELADHTPISRQELETVLIQEGWSVGVPLNDWYIVNSNLEWGDSNDTCYVTDNANLQIQHFGGSYCIPLSAVTLATLRSCGVIK